MSLVCPICSATLEEEGTHFSRHFKYKQFGCGETSCDAEFYTESERNAHCTKKAHKRSFHKTVNPYIDRMIGMLVSDARELTTKDMETVIENRFGSTSTTVASKTPDQPKKKRTLTSLVTPVSAPKKSRAAGAEESSAPASASKPRRSAKEPVPETNNSPVEKTKRTPKTKSVEQQQQPEHPRNATYEEMSAIEKLIGWFDPNAPERRDAAKVACAVCHVDVVYDFIVRRGHVTQTHMAADVDPRDYEDLLKTAMDLSWPDLPNSNLSCQLCMTGLDIRKSLRREHIEKMHTNSLPPLKCPIEQCEKAFRRQCELSAHMKSWHKIDMSKYKDVAFQSARQRRNRCISTMTSKCFPWSDLEYLHSKQLMTTTPTTSSNLATALAACTSAPMLDANFRKDVRVRDVNRTRRAPQYNQNADSSSSSSEEDSEDETTASGADLDDIIIIKEQFNAEVAKRLEGLRTIKTEPGLETEGEEQVSRGVQLKVEKPDDEVPIPQSPKRISSPRVIEPSEVPLPPGPPPMLPEPVTAPTVAPSAVTPPLSRSSDSPDVHPTSFSSTPNPNRFQSFRGRPTYDSRSFHSYANNRDNGPSRRDYHNSAGSRSNYNSSNSRTASYSRPYQQQPHRNQYSRNYWN